MALPQDASFADLLRYHRHRQGYSQDALASKAGVSKDTISDLERGRSQRPRSDTLDRLAAALELSDEEQQQLRAACYPSPLSQPSEQSSLDKLTPHPLTVSPGREYQSVVMSYAHQDEALATQLYTDLLANQVMCWKYTEDLKVGDTILYRVDEAIKLHDKLLLILSESALKSAWIEREVMLTLEREQRKHRAMLFPVALDKAIWEAETYWAGMLRMRYIGDFTQWQDPAWYQSKLIRLLRDLKADEDDEQGKQDSTGK